MAGDVGFVGYGLSAPQHGYDDYAGLDVTGKVVLCFKRNPSWQADGEPWSWESSTPRADAPVTTEGEETRSESQPGAPWSSCSSPRSASPPRPAAAQAPAKKPNILVIWGDDIGGFNISAYNNGMMGYRTPNVDRIAKEGALFTDWYGQQSCSAGRAAFVTGQSPIRTGLTKVGLPGAKLGLQPEDPTIAELLKPQGW